MLWGLNVLTWWLARRSGSSPKKRSTVQLVAGTNVNISNAAASTREECTVRLCNGAIVVNVWADGIKNPGRTTASPSTRDANDYRYFTLTVHIGSFNTRSIIPSVSEIHIINNVDRVKAGFRFIVTDVCRSAGGIRGFELILYRAAGRVTVERQARNVGGIPGAFPRFRVRNGQMENTVTGPLPLLRSSFGRTDIDNTVRLGALSNRVMRASWKF